MDAVERETRIVEQALGDAAREHAAPEDYETVTSFDRARGQFVCLDQGWSGWERIHRVWLHVERRGEKWWVQHDLTYDGIAVALMDAGIPKERIVLAFQHPSRRHLGEFAAA